MGTELTKEEQRGLQNLLLDDMIQGLSYVKMEKKHGIPAIECFQIVRDALASSPVHSQVEQRQIASLRLQRVIEGLWDKVDQGEFKHAEAIIKAVHEMTELNDLIQKTVTHELYVIEDAQATKVLAMMEVAFTQMREKIATLPLNQKAQKELEHWEEWAAEATTNAVTEVVYAEVVED